MKCIVFVRADGRLCVGRPSKGGRLAHYVTLADGGRLPQNGSDGSDGKPPTPAQRVDSFHRGWPVEGVTAAWAETEDEYVRRVLPQLSPGAAAQIVDEAAIPADRTFRNAWKTGVAGVAVDMPKAREIHKERLRDLRKPKMEALDVAYMRADEAGNAAEKQRIAALKQALRDVTADPRIEAAATPEELKNVVPQALQ